MLDELVGETVETVAGYPHRSGDLVHGQKWRRLDDRPQRWEEVVVA